MTATAALLVALGAAVGAPLRLLVAHRWDDRRPHGTLAVNLAGSLLLGALVGAAVVAVIVYLLGATGRSGATPARLALAGTAVGASLQGVIYAVVLVDEVQDTDPAQLRLLRALAGDGRDLVAVGDPDQSIYGFRRRASGRGRAARARAAGRGSAP